MARVREVDLSLVTVALRVPPDSRAHQDIDTLFAALQGTPALEGWRDWAIRELCSSATLEIYEPGSKIYWRGEIAQNWWLVLSGTVLNGNDKIPSGGVIGIMLSDDGRHETAANSVDTVALMRIPYSQYRLLEASSQLRKSPRKARKGMLAVPGQEKDPVITKLFHEQEEKDKIWRVGDSQDESDDGDSPPPSPPSKPRIPHKALLTGDIVFDDESSSYISSPLKRPSKLTASLLATDLSRSRSRRRDPVEFHMDIPEDLVRKALDCPPKSRTPEAVALMMEELQRLALFSSKPEAVRSALCRALVFCEYPALDTLITGPEAHGTHWWAVLSGSVSVHREDGTQVCLGEGEAFGYSCALPGRKDTVTSATVNCQVLYVDAQVFKDAMLEGEKMTLREEDDSGHVVLVAERRAFAGGFDMQNAPYVVVKGLPEKLISQLFARMDGTVKQNDPYYISDFLLTYRTFCKGQDLLQAIFSALKLEETRARALTVLQLWVQNFFGDFEEDSILFTKLMEVERWLAAALEGLPENHDYREKADAIQAAREENTKTRTIQLGRPTERAELGFNIRGGSEFGHGLYISQVVEGSKASESGLQVGDQVMSVNGIDFSSITHRDAVKSLQETHIVMVVKFNPLGLQDCLKPPSPRTLKKRGSSVGTEFSTPPASAEKQKRSSSGSKMKITSIGKKGGTIMKKIFGLKSDAISEESPLRKLQTEFDWTQHDVIKVYKADQSFRFVCVDETSLVRDVVTELCQQWGLGPSDDYSLCEVTVVHGGLVKQTTLKSTMDNIGGALNVHGRYYLKHNTSIETLLPDDAKQELMDPALEVDILQAQPEDIARQLTLKDFKLFSAIESLEYIDFLWKKDEKKYQNLLAFTARFNWVVNWVQSEVCSQRVTRRRADVIKQFIKIAELLLECSNFNSLFAVISGLAAPCVSRLKKTWSAVTSKYEDAYEDLEALMDPSRNMAKYRNLYHARQATPPLIPFFPLLMKDVTFMHEGNKSTLDGLVNFDKLRLMSKELRQVDEFRHTPYNASLMFDRRKDKKEKLTMKQAWSKNLTSRIINHYLKNVDVKLDESALMQMSYTCEPSLQALRSLQISKPQLFPTNDQKPDAPQEQPKTLRKKETSSSSLARPRSKAPRPPVARGAPPPIPARLSRDILVKKDIILASSAPETPSAGASSGAGALDASTASDMDAQADTSAVGGQAPESPQQITLHVDGPTESTTDLEEPLGFLDEAAPVPEENVKSRATSPFPSGADGAHGLGSGPSSAEQDELQDVFMDAPPDPPKVMEDEDEIFGFHRLDSWRAVPVPVHAGPVMLSEGQTSGESEAETANGDSADENGAYDDDGPVRRQRSDSSEFPGFGYDVEETFSGFGTPLPPDTYNDGTATPEVGGAGLTDIPEEPEPTDSASEHGEDDRAAGENGADGTETEAEAESDGEGEEEQEEQEEEGQDMFAGFYIPPPPVFEDFAFGDSSDGDVPAAQPALGEAQPALGELLEIPVVPPPGPDNDLLLSREGDATAGALGQLVEVVEEVVEEQEQEQAAVETQSPTREIIPPAPDYDEEEEEEEEYVEVEDREEDEEDGPPPAVDGDAPLPSDDEGGEEHEEKRLSQKLNINITDADALMQMEPDDVDRMEEDLRVPEAEGEGEVPLADFVVPPPQGMVWLDSPSGSPVRSLERGQSGSEVSLEDNMDFLQAFLVPPPPKSLPASPLSSPRSSRSNSPSSNGNTGNVILEEGGLNDSKTSNC